MKTQLPNSKLRLWILGCAAALTAMPALAESSYSYSRVLEGPATVTAAGGEAEVVDLQQPILVGDRVFVPGGSRLEVVLADRSLLRLGGDSEIDFEAIADSAETDDRATVLRLDRGEAQLIVPEDALGDALPQLETPSATIYVHRAGNFRITVDFDGGSELVVRDGLAEMVSDRGSLLVHAGDKGWVRGAGQPGLELRVADSRDALERWGDWLSAEAARADVPYVDESLRYAAQPLADHGAWVDVGHRRAWRPTVVVDWSPYVHGYWRDTPIGLTWVSFDPWGYVTHHYGSWDLVPGHGWVWYPGAAYAPARVYWYWGPTYVGWCPSGYYQNYYARGRNGSGLGLGIYGWAGGGWDPFRHWSFTLQVDFGRRHRDRHVHRGDHFARHGGPRLERGIITTEPGGRRDGRHDTFADLRREAEGRERRDGRPLPDVSDFVARKPLPPDIERAVLKPVPAAPPRPATPAHVDPPRVQRTRPVAKPVPAPRVDPPRVERLRPVGKPVPVPAPHVDPPRVERLRPVAKPVPAPRVDPPRVQRTRPVGKPVPAPRVDPPRVERLRPVAKPVPAPRVYPPRVERTRPVAKPAPAPRVYPPRVERTRPIVRPAPAPRVDPPRVERTRPVARPAPAPRVDPPRVERTRPVAKPKPVPRAGTPRVVRPQPTVQPAPAQRPDRTVDRARAVRQAKPQARPAKRPPPEKKAAAQSGSKDSKARQRDH